jgi:predicted transposase YbfD/YdcC
VPGGRWLTILMNRIEPALFAAAFTAWVRETWPDKPDFVAIDGKTSRRSHDRALGKAPLHLATAYATTAGLVLGQEAVSEKSNEITAIPTLLDRLGDNGGLKDATVSIDAIATNPTIAQKILDQGADYLLAVKANQPTLRAEMEAYFADAPEEWWRPSSRPTRDMVALRNASYLSPQTRAGSGAIVGFPASCECPAPPASSGSAQQPTQATHDVVTRGIPSLQAVPTPGPPPMQSGGTGSSRMRFTGSWTLSSKTTFTDQKRTWGSQHGHCPTLRHQSGSHCQRQKVDQSKAKASSLQHHLP